MTLPHRIVAALLLAGIASFSRPALAHDTRVASSGDSISQKQAEIEATRARLAGKRDQLHFQAVREQDLERQLADTNRLENLYRRLDNLKCAGDLEGCEKPVVMMLTEGAATIFEAWAAENGETVHEAASLYKGFCGKLRGTVLRLALVCELIAWADSTSPDEPTTIRPDTITAAITFIEDYAKPSALRVFGDAALPEADRNAAQLARHILKHALVRINARDVRREYGIAALKSPEKVDEAISCLVDANWLRAAPSRSGANAGQQRKDFIVNPHAHEASHG